MIPPLRPWQPPHPLDGPRAKIIRASNDLHEFNVKLDAIKSLNPYRLIPKEDTERNEICWYLEARVALGSQFPILAGEIVYHLHSALNHLAWELRRLSGRPTNDTEFPMLSRCDPIRFEKMTKGMPRDAIVLLNGLQPYQRGDAYRTDALWALNRLRNTDAHESLLSVAPSLNYSDIPGIRRVHPPRRGINDGDVLACMPLDLYREHHFEPQVTYTVTLVEGGLPGEDASATLHRINEYVRYVVWPVFTGFFLEKPGLTD